MKWKLGFVSIVVACCGCGLSADDAAGSLRKRAVSRQPAKKELTRKAPAKVVRQDRATVLRAVKGLGDLDQVRVPVFRDNVKPGERAELVARLDKALQEMKAEKGVPREVLDGVRVWESLGEKERVGLLSGDYGEVAAIPTWAVAAVGAAHLTYEVGKDYNWWASSREKFNLEPMKKQDLDYAESKLGFAGKGALTQPELVHAINNIGDLKKVKVPVFKDSVPESERQKVVASLDKTFAKLKNSSKLPLKGHEGVRIWEQLSPKQRLDMLSGRLGHASSITVVFISHATLTEPRFQDSAKNFNMVVMSSKDLDYVAQTLKIPPKMPSVFEADRAIKSIGKLGAAKVPVFKDSVKEGARKELVARLGKALQDMRGDVATLPPEIQEGVRIWEGLDLTQREQMLGGKLGQVAAVPTWAVAAVGAAKLVYDVGKDYNWWGSSREQLDLRGMSAKELDYINPGL